MTDAVSREQAANFLSKLREEHPEEFDEFMCDMKYDLSLMSLPPREFNLLEDLEDAVPFEVKIPAYVRKKEPEIFTTEYETVSDVHFLGEMAGISVDLEPTESVPKSRRISITLVEMLPRHPLRKRVNDYRKKRIKKLRKQDDWGGWM